MVKRAGKSPKAKATANKPAASLTPKQPAAISRRKKSPAKRGPSSSKGKKTKAGKVAGGRAAAVQAADGEGVPRSIGSSGLLEDPTHVRGDGLLIERAIRERWPSAAPEINGGLRQAVETIAAKAAQNGNDRVLYRMGSLLLRMEEQNQRDQIGQIQRMDEANRIDEARNLLEEMQAVISHASENPDFFDALHQPEGAQRHASARKPRRLGNGSVRGGVEVIRAPSDRQP